MWSFIFRMVLSAALLFGTLPVHAHQPEQPDGMVFPTNSLPVFDAAPATELPAWFLGANQMLGELLQGLLSSFVADQSGLTQPNSEQNPSDIFSARLGQSRYKVMLQGAGNLRALQFYNGNQGNYLFTVLQGGFGVEYDVVIPDGSEHSMTVAIRLSPLYGEIALIRTPNEQFSSTLPPQGVFAGSSFGIEISKRFDAVEPGMRAYTRVEWQNLNYNDPSLSYYAALYCRFHLGKILSSDPKRPSRVVIMPILSYYDRGDTKVDMYAWNHAQAYSDVNALSRLHKFWEGQVKLEVKF